MHATVEFVDIGGLVEGAQHRARASGNRFLAGIREVDAIVFVLRAFEDDDVVGADRPARPPPPRRVRAGPGRPRSVENQLERQRKAAKLDKSLAGEVDGARRAPVAVLAEGTPLYRAGLGRAPRALLRPFFLLTNKPVLVVVNSARTSSTTADAVGRRRCVAELGAEAEVLGVCVQLEAEAAQLAAGRAGRDARGLGLGEGALPRFVRAAYHLLGLRTFLTTGDKESRAWTFRAGAKAPECAGVIHSDFQRGFIRAEVIHWDELLELGSWAKAKEVGKLRVEGKDYEVADGDVLEIRFNV